MDIKITAAQMLKILYIISWIIFFGLCIEACGIIFNAFATLVLNPEVAKRFWQEIDLSNLYQYDPGHFFATTTIISIVAVLKAILFYLIVRILHDKKLNMLQPFNVEVSRFISNASYLTLGIGLFSWWGVNYSEWMIVKGVNMPGIQHLHLGGADVWLFMGITLLVIAQIFKRGIEIQAENDLTV